MSRTDELPPDQRAALSLLLRQRKTHAEVAEMLHIPTEAVHDRAHAALIMLAPREARGLSVQKREQIGEYLLGQQPSVAEQMRVRNELASPGAARTWALALAAELAPVAGENLPQIPPAPAAASSPAATGPAAPTQTTPAQPASAVPVAAAAGTSGPPWETTSRALPSSRLGGGLLLAILLAAIVVTIILVTNGSSHKSKPKPTTTASSTAPKTEARFTLKPPESSSSSAGVVEIISQEGKRALYVVAEHIPATKGFFYAIWLYNSHSSAEALSRSPEVGKTHGFAGAVALPGNASEFKEVLITKETDTKPTRPGHVVLRGPFSVPGE